MIADLVSFIAGLGTAAEERVYQRAAPQRADYPHIIVTRVGGPSGLDLSGADGISRSRYQLDIYGAGIDCLPELQRIARAITKHLHGFHGLMGSTSVLSISKDNEQDLDDFDGDRILRRILQDYFVIYRED